MLADIENELDRNVYLSKTAKEYDISQEVLKQQVEREIKKRRAGQKKQNWRAMTTAPMLRDPVNPEAAAHRREANAEELILCYLFRNPDALEQIRAQIAPEAFVTDLNRRIYADFTEKLMQGYPFSLSLFNDSFTPDEMGHITGISSKNADIAVSEQSVRDCIAVLKQHSLTEPAPETLSDEDFSARIARLRHPKQSN